LKNAVSTNDWDTASYKLGVGAVNTAEVAASIAIGGKIGGKIPTGKISVPKVSAVGKIRNAIDNFGTPALAGANGMVISGAVPAEVSVASTAVASASGVVAGAAVGQNVVYNSQFSGQSSSGGTSKESSGNKKIQNNKDVSSRASRRESFRQAKQQAGIPNSSQFNKHKYVYDGTSENRTVYEFIVNNKKKYVIQHLEDGMGRGPHFHGADDVKGNPFEKGRYNQYDGHHPEDFKGYKNK